MKCYNHKIIIADSRTIPEVLDRSVHLVITSPPYWKLKDCNNAQQVGFNDTYEEYINNRNLVWERLKSKKHQMGRQNALYILVRQGAPCTLFSLIKLISRKQNR